jgi:myo-inositol 2-dehydrogenase/D-chiro-inositol 1-dehydrogenase
MTTRVGVVGVGFFGKILLNVLRETPGVEVVAIFDRMPGRVEDIDLQNARFFNSLQEMYDNQPMDATVIAEIPGFHLLPTRLAAAKGIHVFCEKPMANTLADCDEMIAACAHNNVKLMIGFKHRFAQAMAHVKRELPKLGRPLWGLYTYPLWKVDDPGWKFDENGTKGIIVENMVHAFDLMRYFFGDFHTLYAEGDTFVYPNTTLPDSTIMVIRFKNGAIGGIGGGCTSDQRITREYLDMHFANGVTQVSGMLDQPSNLRILMRAETAPEEFSYPGSDGIREEIKHFIDCVQQDKTPISTGTDGKKALEIALAAIESIRTHSSVALDR